MIKYDCNKIKDYVHEVKRICDYYGDCEWCPLNEYNCHSFDALGVFCDETIPIVQKWSDENPEKVKLTKEEKILLECLADDDTNIRRWHDTLRLEDSWNDNCPIYIKNTLFPFIEDGKAISIAELLKYEVKED